MDPCSSNICFKDQLYYQSWPFLQWWCWGSTSLRLIVISLILGLPMGFSFTLEEDMKLKRSGPMSSMEEKKSIFWAGKCEKNTTVSYVTVFYFNYRGGVEWDVKESARVDHWRVQGSSAPIYIFLRAREMNDPCILHIFRPTCNR